MVNESNQCFTEEFNETGFCPDAPGDCEPMSDKQCYASHVRVLENNPARVVVEWRYRLANPEQHWAFYDAKTGLGFQHQHRAMRQDGAWNVDQLAIAVRDVRRRLVFKFSHGH